jgi:two-component system response regulator AlgR
MYLDPSLSVLIIEDNPGFSGLLKLMLQEIGLSSIRIAVDYKSGLQSFEAQQPNICLMDIDLGKNQKSGIDLAEKIRETDDEVSIIFLTANYTEDYYEKSRHTRPSGFMNKELSRFKLHQAIDLALMHKPQAQPALGEDNLSLPNTTPLVNNTQVFFKIGDSYKAIPVKDVAYFYADHKLTYARVGERNYPTSVQLKTLEEEFADLFVRIHKTYLVNFKFIESLQTKDNSVIVAGESLPVGYAYRKQFFSRLQILR